jgi:hypothetical protein
MLIYAVQCPSFLGKWEGRSVEEHHLSRREISTRRIGGINPKKGNTYIASGMGSRDARPVGWTRNVDIDRAYGGAQAIEVK